MTLSPTPSTLDIMTLREVREANESGAGVAVLDRALGTVLWANTGGHALLGLAADAAATWPRVLSANLPAARQIGAMSRVLDVRGSARLLLRTGTAIGAKPVVADLQRVRLGNSDYVLLAIEVVRRHAETESEGLLAKRLLGESGLADALVHGPAGRLAGLGEAVGDAAVEPAIAAFLDSGKALHRIETSGRRTTLARIAANLVLVQHEPKVAEPSDAPEPEPAEGPEAVTVLAAPSESRTTRLFSVRRRALVKKQAPTNMTALVERWHSRQASPAGDTGGEAEFGTGDEESRTIAADPATEASAAELRHTDESAVQDYQPQVADADRDDGAQRIVRAPEDEAETSLSQDVQEAPTGKAVPATDDTVATKPVPVRSLWGTPAVDLDQEATSYASLDPEAPAMETQADDRPLPSVEEVGVEGHLIDVVAADAGLVAPIVDDAPIDSDADAAMSPGMESDVPAVAPAGPSDDALPAPNDDTWAADDETSQPEEKESAVVLPDLPPEDAEALEEIPATDAEEPGEQPILPEAMGASPTGFFEAVPTDGQPPVPVADIVSPPAAEVSADVTTAPERFDEAEGRDAEPARRDVVPVEAEGAKLPETDDTDEVPAVRARGPIDDDAEDVEAREAIEAALGATRDRSIPTQSIPTREAASRAPDELIGGLGLIADDLPPSPSRIEDDGAAAVTTHEGDGGSTAAIADEAVAHADGEAFDGAPSPDEAPIDPTIAGSSAQAPAAEDVSGKRPETFSPSFGLPPVRFVWQIDRTGRFSALSPEFGAAVGSKAADVIGRSFRDVSQVFGFDVDGEIARLLDRRDTWSGRSILWPVENSDRKAPVDLAALPVYAADRSFDGFRGFGVLRMNDAVVDADAIGHLLGGGGAPSEVSPEASPDREEPQAPGPENVVSAEPAQADRPILRTFAGDFPLTPFGRRQEPPKGVPVGPAAGPSTLEPLPDGTEADEAPKVIRLEERRRPRDGVLSQAEEAAFRAIGMKLGTHGEAESPGALRFADAPSLDDVSGLDDGPSADAFADDADADADAGIGIGTAAAAAVAVAVAEEAASDGEPAAAEGDDTTAPPLEATHEASAEPVGLDVLDAATPLPVAGDELEAQAPDTIDEGSFAADRAKNEELSENQGSSAETDGATAAAGTDTDTDTDTDETTASGGNAEAGEASPSTAELDSIFGPLPLPILVQAQQTLVYANREFSDLTGYADIAALNAAGGLDSLFVEPSEDGDRSPGEIAIRRSNGQMSDARVHMQRVTLSDRSFLLMSFAPSAREIAATAAPGAALVSESVVASPTPDVSAPSEAQGDEADLREQIEELQAVLDTATDGIVLLDPPGHIRAMNGSAQALFGAGQSEHQGKHLSTLFAHESQKATHDYLEMLRDNGLAGILNDGREVIGRVAQGGFIPLFITVGRLTGERGWCVVIRDIAHWKRIEEDLVNARRQAEAASLHKSRFLANISHELRTPLNAIIGFADVMASECFGPIGNERYLEYLGDIKRSGHHVLDLVNDLLDISKIEAGKLDLSFEAVALNEVVSEVVSLMQPQANRERVIVRSNLPSSVPPVVADRRTIRQIALNLVANAIRFTPAGGQIIVSTTYTAEGDVVLRFRDSGIGMTEREIEIALTPFQQVHAPSVTRGEGTGLGLPLTKAMVEANRAIFAIHSTPGEGTLVEISFPSQRVLAD